MLQQLRAGRPVIWILLEALLDERDGRVGHILDPLVVGFAVDHLIVDLFLGAAGEGCAACQDYECDDAGGPNIDLVVVLAFLG